VIVSSAVQLNDGRVFVGRRHGDAYKAIKEIYDPSDINKIEVLSLLRGNIQGFLTDTLVFLTREEAYIEAKKCGQLRGLCEEHPLYSEDLWTNQVETKELLDLHVKNLSKSLLDSIDFCELVSTNLKKAQER